MNKPSDLQALRECTGIAELAAKLGGLDVSVRSVPALSRILRDLDEPPRAKVALLGNITLDLLAPHVEVESAREGMLVRVFVGDYGQYFQDVLDERGELREFDPDLTLLALSPGELEPEGMRSFPDLDAAARRDLRQRLLGHVDGWLRAALGQLRSTFLVCSFARPHFLGAGIADPNEEYGETEFQLELNLDLLRRLKDEPRAHLFDVDRVLSAVGHRAVHDPRMYYLARMHWSDACLPAVAHEIVRHIRAHTGETKKCIVLDLDNTLWGGVVGEEGPQGVKVGPGDPVAEAYRDFQVRLRAIKARGLLLALCSKNNPEDVQEVFRTRGMPLAESDFAAMQINWDHKHVNLARIAEALNIGTDSLVFIDDNPAEISLVEQMMPEVKSVLLPSDPALLPSVLENLADFEKVQILVDDREKTRRYRENRKRESVEHEAGDLLAYLTSLETRIVIRRAAKSDLPRVHQLFTKTNQFNVTTIRYALGDVERFQAAADHDLAVVSARDRFGDLGVIGLYLIEEGTPAVRIDSFILSCRAMGRGIEAAMMNRIKADHLDGQPEKRLVARYLPTRKNVPVREFFESQGFRVSGEGPDGAKEYVLASQDASPVACDWIEIEDG